MDSMHAPIPIAVQVAEEVRQVFGTGRLVVDSKDSWQQSRQQLRSKSRVSSPLLHQLESQEEIWSREVVEYFHSREDHQGTTADHLRHLQIPGAVPILLCVSPLVCSATRTTK